MALGPDSESSVFFAQGQQSAQLVETNSFKTHELNLRQTFGELKVKKRIVHNSDSDSDMCLPKFINISEFFFMKTELFVHGDTVFYGYWRNKSPRSFSDW